MARPTIALATLLTVLGLAPAVSAAPPPVRFAGSLAMRPTRGQPAPITFACR
jgi:hypothetical protein